MNAPRRGPTAPGDRPPRLFAGLGRRPRIGLLGGSFNPAHDGHRTIGLRALRELRLDAVWWLVSPQNPLKPRAGMAPLAERLAGARRVARHPRIRASALEAALGTRHTVDTVAALRRRWPKARFVWLTGADNLLQMPAWRRWPALFRAVPVAVFDRPPILPAPCAARRRRGSPASGGGPRPASPMPRRRRGRSCVGGRTRKSATRLRALRAAEALEEAGEDEGRRGEPVIGSDKPSRWAETIRRIALGSLEEDKAGDVIVIDLVGKTSIADLMIIASGRSARHVAAVVGHLVERLKNRGMAPRSVEGLPKADWVLVDAGDVIVHVFRPEVREFYNLEKMWAVPLPEPAVQ